MARTVALTSVRARVLNGVAIRHSVAGDVRLLAQIAMRSALLYAIGRA